MSEIKDGSIVVFNAGGPPMQVTDVTDAGARVNWFNRVTGEFDSEVIPVRYLTAVKIEVVDHE